MKKRLLITGKLVKEMDKEFSMTISSKCPDKWLFVDLEHFNVWHKKESAKSQKNVCPFWRFATKEEILGLIKVAEYYLKNA